MTSTSRFIDFSRPFIEAAKNVFETMVYTKLEVDRPSLKKNPISKGDVSAVLGIVGDMKDGDDTKPYQAMLVLSWPFDTYIKVANAMLMEAYTEYNEEMADVGGEICNMITGNAKRTLLEMGYTSNKAIPSMIVGPGHTIKYPPGTVVIITPINSTHGVMYMELCYRED